MKKEMKVIFDITNRKVTVIDFDGDKFEATGFLMLLGNSPEEGTCYCSNYGDFRSIAEAFAFTAKDPKFGGLMAHIKERMGKRFISAEEALEKFEKDDPKTIH